MAEKALPEHLVFGLDIGTRSIVGTVGYKVNKDTFRVVAQVSRLHKTRAMMDGQIHDISKVAETISMVKAELEKMTGRQLTDVCIAAAGRVLKTVTVHEDYSLPEEAPVTDEHIHTLELMSVEKAYEQLRKEAQTDKIDFYCVGYTVITYYLNDYSISSLQGHKAAKIGTDLIATFMPNEVVDGLYAAVEAADLFVANLTLEPIAAINVAIPDSYRLLNLALVDVGAGTSDISITRDGSIVAFGMMPYAGDEITEDIVKHYLVDFNTAENIKLSCSKKKKVQFKDIMGLNKETTPADILKVVSPTVEMITKSIADKIKEINGGKSVSAVFIVGGGGKIPGFTSHLAKNLDIQEERVAIRGEEVMKNIIFDQEDIKKDSTLVTPIGICLNFYEQNNNFIFVNVNGERVKIYDNGKLTIVDAALQVGLSNDGLFPRRGKALEFFVNGKKRLVRGEIGEAAEILINGESAGLNTGIEQNDKISITLSTAGAPARCEMDELPEYKDKGVLNFIFNGKKIECPRFVMVNDELVSGFYEIKENDRIQFLNHYTLKQVLEFMDVDYKGTVMINNKKAGLLDKVYDNFEISCNYADEIVSDASDTDKKGTVSDASDTDKKGTVSDAADTDKKAELEDAASETPGNADKEELESAASDETDTDKKAELENAVSETPGYAKKEESESADDGIMYSAGNEEPDNAESDNEKSDNAESYNAESDNAESVNTESDNIESGNSALEMTDYKEKEDGRIAANPRGIKITVPDLEHMDKDRLGVAVTDNVLSPRSVAIKKATRKEPLQAAKKPEGLKPAANSAVNVNITVNGEKVVLKKKASYTMVDILDFYPFDLSEAKGSKVGTRLNGADSDFFSPVKENDKIEIFWIP